MQTIYRERVLKERITTIERPVNESPLEELLLSFLSYILHLMPPASWVKIR